MQIQELLREHCPNIRPLRKMVSKARIKVLESRILPPDEIRKGEESVRGRGEVVRKYSLKWPEYCRKANERIDALFANSPVYRDRNDLDEVREAMLFYRYAYGFQPDEYLFFDLEGKPVSECREYVSDIERIRFDCQMSDMADSKVYKDKGNTYRFFRPYYRREAISISSPRDLKAFLDFVGRHPVFVKKEVYESCGRSIELVDIAATGMSREDYFTSLISRGKHVLEERIRQSGVLNTLNASSVNTVRCITFNTNDGIIIPYCFIKTGRAGSFVDNGGAGGILAGIDCDTGMLCTDGIDEANNHYKEHPDSHVPFNGFQLPEWDRMKELCRKMSAMTPTVGYVSWDMAHTEDGWVVVEGNNCGQMIGPQMVFRRGIRAEILGIMKNMKLMA